MEDFIKGDTLLIKDLTDEINKLRQDNYKLSDELSTTKIALAKKEQERLDTLNDNKYYKNLCSELTQQLTETNKLMQEYLNKCLSLEQQLEEKQKEYKQKITEIGIGTLAFKKVHNDNANQTAIAELEKVKEWANNMYDGWKSNDGVNLDAKSGICNTLRAVCGMVNQQIKELKGEK